MAQLKKKPMPTEQEIRQQQQRFNERRTAILHLLEGYKEVIRQSLPVSIKPERMIQAVMNAISRNVDIMQCSDVSIIASVIYLSECGMLPIDVTGEAYLSAETDPERGTLECQAIVGYKGYRTLAMRTGKVMTIYAKPVYSRQTKKCEDLAPEDGDFFVYEFGSNERIQHIPCDETDESKITHYYAKVKFMNGGEQFEVMPRKLIEASRDKSKNYRNAEDKTKTVWGTNPVAMGCKTVLLKLLNSMELSSEIQVAAAYDSASEYGRQNLVIDYMDKVDDNFRDKAIEHVINSGKDEKNIKRSEQIEASKKKGNAAAEAALNMAKNGKK